MELKEALERRSSVRQFTDEPVKIEHLQQMVRHAGLAPSINNAQPWRFIAVLDPRLKHKMVQLVSEKLDKVLPTPHDPDQGRAFSMLRTNCTFFSTAPAVVAVATRTYEAMIDQVLEMQGLTQEEVAALRNYPDSVSLGAAIQNFLLSATSLGYGSCWLTGPLVAARELESLLDIEPPWTLGALLAVGRAEHHIDQSAKKPLEEIWELRT